MGHQQRCFHCWGIHATIPMEVTSIFYQVCWIHVLPVIPVPTQLSDLDTKRRHQLPYSTVSCRGPLYFNFQQDNTVCLWWCFVLSWLLWWQRSILGISWKNKVTNEKVREATALPKLEDIIRCRRLRWLGHLSRMDHHRLPRQALTWEPEGFRRRPGRLRQNWKDVIKKDLRKTGISWDEVEEAAEDRRSWRNRVAQCVFDAGWTRNQERWWCQWSTCIQFSTDVKLWTCLAAAAAVNTFSGTHCHIVVDHPKLWPLSNVL